MALAHVRRGRRASHPAYYSVNIKEMRYEATTQPGARPGVRAAGAGSLPPSGSPHEGDESLRPPHVGSIRRAEGSDESALFEANAIGEGDQNGQSH